MYLVYFRISIVQSEKPKFNVSSFTLMHCLTQVVGSRQGAAVKALARLSDIKATYKKNALSSSGGRLARFW